MGPHEFASILLCPRHAKSVIPLIENPVSEGSSDGSEASGHYPDHVNSSMLSGNLMHEAIQYVLAGDTIDSNLSRIVAILDEVEEREEWTNSLIQTLPESSSGKQSGNFFDEDDAFDLRGWVCDFIDFLDNKGWKDAVWEREFKVSGSVQTEWGEVLLNGYVDLRGKVGDEVVIIELKSSQRSSDSWKFQAGLYAEMAEIGSYQHVVVWSPKHYSVSTQEEAIEILRLRTMESGGIARPVPYLCIGCDVHCDQRAY